jgi:transposase
LSAIAQTVLERNPFSGHVFVFCGRRGDLIKLLWWDRDGLCLFAKLLERGRFIWPKVESGTVLLTRAQFSMLLEGIDWRRPIRTSALEISVLKSHDRSNPTSIILDFVTGLNAEPAAVHSQNPTVSILTRNPAWTHRDHGYDE